MRNRIYDINQQTFVVANPLIRRPLRISGRYAVSIKEAIINNNLTGLPQEIQATLHNYLVPSVSSEAMNDCQRFPLEEISLVLLLTLDCNNRCLYCFSAMTSNNSYSGNLSLEDAIKTINSCLSIAKKVKIVFFGGEPLLQWKQIKQIVKHFSDISERERLIFTITSNLTLSPHDLCSFSSEHKIGYLTNLDCHEEIHNKLRPSKMHKSNYPTIIQNIKNFHSYGVVCDIRTTVTSVTLPHLYDFASYLIAEFGVTQLNFPPLMMFQSDGSLVDSKLLPNSSEYINILKSIVINLRIPPTQIHPLDSLCKNYLTQTKILSPCGMGEGHVIELTPNGDIYPCSYLVGDSKYFLGNVISSSIDESWLNNLRSRLSSISNSKSFHACNHCDFMNYCAGGCVVPWLRLKELSMENTAYEQYAKGIFCGLAELSFELMSVLTSEVAYQGKKFSELEIPP